MASPYSQYVDKIKARYNLNNLEAEYINQILSIVYLQGKVDRGEEDQALIHEAEGGTKKGLE